MSRALPAFLALLILTPPATAAPAATIANGTIVVTGLSANNGLRVIVAQGTPDEIASRPPMAGEWTEAGGNLVFRPRYPLKAGTRYRVLGKSVSMDVRTPAAAARRTALTHIYPAAADIPANVLRFYLEFNQPMPRGEVYKHVSLLTGKGERVTQPFLEIDDELWNADQTRLTLLIDPGRIKKELKPRLDLGPVFEAGRKYTLIVSGKWPTLSGTPLGKDVTKTITTTKPESDALDPKVWTVTPPSDANGRLTVAFGRLIDHPLLERCLTVIGPNGQLVTGTGTPADHDRGWTFRPAAPWAPGQYNLRVDPVLEDVCGNRVGRPFEIDVLRRAPKEVRAKTLDLPFVVGR